VSYRETSDQIEAYRRQIAEARAKMRALQQNRQPEPVEDHSFTTMSGEVRLSDLFGSRADLFVVHNMGASCPYCTLWADGYNGTYPHLSSRAAFVVASPDQPEKQKAFAESRGWQFPMVSDPDVRFATAMGYAENGHPMPGVSVLKKQNGSIVRVSDSRFAPGDDFCPIYHFFDLLSEGAADWSPRFRYT
jgi:predicted dithiol-disulfide oxidoreductase (DUF899 family)